MAYTIKDIAAEVGVSITTVSLVLNHKPCRVSDATRKRIIEVAEKHHYMPNWSARTLVMHESRTLGLIIPDFSNPYFSELAKGVELDAQKRGYSVIFCNSNECGRKDVDNLKLMIGRQVDAIIIVPSIGDEETMFINEFNRLASISQLPIIQFDRQLIGGDYDTVSIDNRMGGYLATKLLLTQGYTRVGCITGPLETASAKQRYIGYCDAMEEYGFTDYDRLVQHGDYTMEAGFQQTQLLLKESVDAIFACNDMMAIGAAKAMRLNGKHIGTDYALVGYDNSPISAYLETPLTSVDQNAYDMGKTASRLAVGAIKDKKEGKKRKRQNICFSPILVIRETTPPKGVPKADEK